MKTKAGQGGSYGDGEKINTEGTEFGHRGHREERATAQSGNRGWGDSWVRGNGKAIAVAGWGHLCLPFYAAAQWRCGGGGELRLAMSPGGDGFASAGKLAA
jgi:hypothetical protein